MMAQATTMTVPGVGWVKRIDVDSTASDISMAAIFAVIKAGCVATAFSFKMIASMIVSNRVNFIILRRALRSQRLSLKVLH